MSSHEREGWLFLNVLNIHPIQITKKLCCLFLRDSAKGEFICPFPKGLPIQNQSGPNIYSTREIMHSSQTLLACAMGLQTSVFSLLSLFCLWKMQSTVTDSGPCPKNTVVQNPQFSWLPNSAFWIFLDASSSLIFKLEALTPSLFNGIWLQGSHMGLSGERAKLDPGRCFRVHALRSWEQELGN